MKNIKNLFFIFTFSILLINESRAQDTATFFPNPFSTHFTVNVYMDKADPVSITIYNSLGQIVDSSIQNTFLLRGQHHFILGDSLKSNAVYIMKISFGNFKTNIFKLVKNSPPTPIRQNNINSKDLILFPNPAKDMVQIFTANDQMPYPILIYNHEGALIKQIMYDPLHTTIDLNDFPSGLYTVLIPESGISLKLIVTKE